MDLQKRMPAGAPAGLEAPAGAGRIGTPIGTMHVAWTPRGLIRVAFDEGAAVPGRGAARIPGTFARAFEAYFAGAVTALAALPVDPGGSPFQRRVRTALRAVPPGRTLSYGALAASLGTPSAARALGRAAATNPVALVVPCHRLVGADGALTGFRWGLERKRWLLAHEAAHAGGIAGAERMDVEAVR